MITCLVAGYIWFIYNLYTQSINTNSNGIHFCIIKSLTGIPCPSCGSTRSVIEFFHGNFINALYINPLGYLIVLLMVSLPVWISFDLITDKSSFYSFYKKVEIFISKRIVAFLLIILILANWYWNIYKGL